MNQANELVQCNSPEAPFPMKQFVLDISTTTYSDLSQSGSLRIIFEMYVLKQRLTSPAPHSLCVINKYFSLVDST
jgi:hypothetical protein